MRLAHFIRANTIPIVTEWENFAKSMAPAGDHTGSLAIRDHIDQILDFIIADIDSPETDAEQIEKSRGQKAEAPYPSAAEVHASLRYDGGFNMDQMVSEYRALRTSVVRLWKASRTSMSMEDVDDLTRFNEAVDQALKESIADYSKKQELARGLFLGILGHDLRNPLSAISTSASLLPRFGTLSTRQVMLQAQIAQSSGRATEIVEKLVDLTHSRLGSGLPIIRMPMSMGLMSHQLVDEMRAIYPQRKFDLEVSGDVVGVWDKARLAQVFSNLIGNAVQYGFRSAPIGIRVEGTPHEVIVSVHNEGDPIRPDMLDQIFHALTRGRPLRALESGTVSANLGLGLFISKEIVTAHGGEIQVSSSQENGTVFRASFPREHRNKSQEGNTSDSDCTIGGDKVSA